MTQIRVAAALLLLAGAASPVFAKAPAGTKSAEDLIAKAVQDEIDRKTREAEAARDPTAELIDAFRDKAKGLPLSEGLKLAKLMVDAEKDEKLVPYRKSAADALVKRFAVENTKDDPAVRKVRSEIAVAILDLMKSKDAGALEAIEAVLKEWYPGYLRDAKFDVKGKPADRNKAFLEMKKRLKDK